MYSSVWFNIIAYKCYSWNLMTRCTLCWGSCYLCKYLEIEATCWPLFHFNTDPTASIAVLRAWFCKANSERKRKGAWENKGFVRVRGGLPGPANKAHFNSPLSAHSNWFLGEWVADMPAQISCSLTNTHKGPVLWVKKKGDGEKVGHWEKEGGDTDKKTTIVEKEIVDMHHCINNWC